MKKYIYIAVAAIVLILGSIVFIQKKTIDNIKNENVNLINTVNAYSNENSALKESNREFELTAAQLTFLNDSLIMSLDKARRDLGIKDKEIKRLGYIASTAHRIDTLRFTDTLFLSSVAKVDTTILDKNGWYRCNVGLNYPNEIIVEPIFKSEKYIITHVTKETINPPKKCWLGRLFQKKHDVLTVDVVENNPFITNDRERFITIIK